MSKSKATKNIDQLLSSEDEQPKKVVTKKVEKVQQKKKVQDSDDSSEESVEFIKNKQPRKESNSQKANNTTASKKPVKKVESSDEESSEEAPKKPAAKAPAKPVKKVESSDEESSEEAPKKPATKAPAKPVKKVESSDEESSEEAPKKPASKAPTKKVESESEEEEIEFKPQPKSAPQKSNCTELFVKNLPWKADENVLYDFFGKYGTVNNVKVLYDKMTGKARGLAFIEFSTRGEAQSAIDNASSLVIEGRNLQVSFSDEKDTNRSAPGGFNKGGFNNSGFNNNNNGGFQRKNFDGEKFTAFVGNLGFKTNEQSVSKFFGDCGNVIDVRIAKNPEDGRSKGYCHVDFDSNEALQKALGKAGQNLDGRDIRVDASTPRQGGGDSTNNF